jgi:hypothetical protein
MATCVTRCYRRVHPLQLMRIRRVTLSTPELLAPHLCIRQFYELTIFDRISVPGDEFALHGSGLLCRDDHELVDREDNNNFSISVKEEEFRYGLVVRVPKSWLGSFASLQAPFQTFII